ncbi:MAG: hypothetical protein AAF653_02990 [Chloroflexota bacterium]
MPTNRDELKARLLAQAEATIDKLLLDERLSDQMTLSEIESVVGESEANFCQRSLEEIIATQQANMKT